MSDMLYCNNCGKQGHQYHQCKLPITSYGIIAFMLTKDGIKYLLIRRKDTLGYVDFIRGKYPLNNVVYLMNMLNEMTVNEKKNLREKEFKELWYDLWGEKAKSSGYQRMEERNSQDKLEQLKTGLCVCNKTTTLERLVGDSICKWEEPEWGFPKGRRNYMETDLDCALREWEEETGYNKHRLKIIRNLLPFEEIFTGSNYKSYKHKYYIGMYNNGASCEDKCDSFERSEVGKMEWKTFENALASIRPYNTEKKSILKNINLILLSSFKKYK